MKTEVTFRTATLNDYESVCRLLRELDDQHVGMRPDVFRPIAGPARPREQISRFVDQDDADIFVAEMGTDMIGLATVQVTDAPAAPMFRRCQRASMDNLIIRRELRGMGIGKGLLDRVIEWAKSRGLQSIEINVWTDNEPGMTFFTSSGFKPFCQRMELRIDKPT